MTLKITNLTKSFNGKVVVNNVSLEIKPGEIVGLLGPNGAGKTTSFDMVVGLIRPDRGSVQLFNEDITRSQVHERSKAGIGYLTQEPSVFRRLTVEENLKLIWDTLGPNGNQKEVLSTPAPKGRGSLSSAERQHSVLPPQRGEARSALLSGSTYKNGNERLEELLKEFDLIKLRNNIAISLSGGERRRVEIARVLACDPKFVLLDEPFTGIDPIAIQDIQRLIVTLREKRNIGILLTDHNPRATLSITDRAYIIQDGKILLSGEAKEIAKDPIALKYYLGEDFDL